MERWFPGIEARGELVCNGARVLTGEDENVLAMDGAASCVNVPDATCTFKLGHSGKPYVTCILSQ